MTNSVFEEIHGFSSPLEYGRFVDYLRKQCEPHIIEEISADPKYGRGEIYGGRWFKELDTGHTWRLIEPDPHFYGLWEQVKN